MSWTEIDLAGHPCDVFEPPAPHEHGYVLIYLHGVHVTRLTGNSVFTSLFEQHGFRVIAPATGPSWWTDKICDAFDPNMTAERHVLDNVIPFIEQRWQITPTKIGLFGTSMGGQGALRLAYKHPDTFPVVAGISPAVDYQIRYNEGDDSVMQMYDEPEAVRQDTATLHIHPLNWPRHQFFCCCPTDYRWWDSVDRLRMKLYSLGVPHICDLDTDAGGHGFDYYNAMAETTIQFLADRLDQERRHIKVL